MGLLQKAVETYDTMSHRAGVMYEEEKEPLAPISHIMTRANIEITLDQNGTFISSRAVGKEEAKIIIPVTEESAGRTSAPCAHPLCDQLGYVSPYDETKHTLYVKSLSEWANSEAYPELCAERDHFGGSVSGGVGPVHPRGRTHERKTDGLLGGQRPG